MFVTGDRNKNLQKKMADISDFRRVQCKQRYAMAPIQYYYKYYRQVLRRGRLLRGDDQYDLYDDVHSIHFSSELFP